ncbi:STE/STE11 protein kinase [Aphanomyces invadans]|uniref:STE/STE11 protein kinase n=1 Tax=Aphanomyces invadans TaxID=157072 RepID=A0A024T9J7_9STRA|nr:STE/STE11 protein kinase [Aphanomyces invadans]ETV89997.1 STE/STE11 protein kinase [Aphanomyces invadans]|eukprot:XP_008881371.1 STE/STE11 protein kinase [Aphanomyces invadans]
MQFALLTHRNRPETTSIVHEKPSEVACDGRMDSFVWQRGKLIGRGRFGKVYVGILLSTATMMAVKQVRVRDERGLDEIEGTFVPEEEESIENILGEVRIGQSLYHPHVVEYYGAEQEGNIFSIFMEYLPLGSISGLLKACGPLDESIVRAYTYQLLQGLVYLHSRGIAHRDLKCANLLLSDAGCLKIADFGAATDALCGGFVDEGIHHRSSQDGVGSPFWMAPESVKANGSGSSGWTKSDVWSVGCCVIEMATGTPPWSNFSNPLTAMFHIASETAMPTIPAHLSDAAHAFLALCFVKDPALRPTALDLLSHAFVATVPPFGPTYLWFNSTTKPLDGGWWWFDHAALVWTYSVRVLGGVWFTTEASDGNWDWRPDVPDAVVEIARMWLHRVRSSSVETRRDEQRPERVARELFLNQSEPASTDALRTVRVVADYVAADATELTLTMNDVLVVDKVDETGWWFGTAVDGRAGWFPCTYVEWVRAPDNVLGLVRALGTYEPTSEGELHLQDHDLVQVLETPSDGWWRGHVVHPALSCTEGWFPCTYVEWLPLVEVTWMHSNEWELHVEPGDVIGILNHDENGWTEGFVVHRALDSVQSAAAHGWFPTTRLNPSIDGGGCDTKSQDSHGESDEEYVLEYQDGSALDI